jgi:peroxiredoxin
MGGGSSTKIAYFNLMAGDPAPRFHQRSTKNPSYAFDPAAGRYIVLCFFVSAGDPGGAGLSRASCKTVLSSTTITSVSSGSALIQPTRRRPGSRKPSGHPLLLGLRSADWPALRVPSCRTEARGFGQRTAVLGRARPHLAGSAGVPLCAGWQRYGRDLCLSPAAAATSAVCRDRAASADPVPAELVRTGFLPAPDFTLRDQRRQGIRLHA